MMKNALSVHTFKKFVATFFAVFGFVTASAGPGHDHGNEAPVAIGASSPRVQAHSDVFELVGIVNGQQMRLFLDRFDTNEPVANAQIALEVSGPAGQTTKLAAKPAEDGSYLVESAAFAGTGTLALSFVVNAGAETDLLGGDLQLAQAGPVTHDHAHGGALQDWWAHAGALKRWAAAGVALLLLAGLCAWAARRLLGPRHAGGTGVRLAAAGLGIALVFGPGGFVASPAWAGPGHDHGDESGPAASGNSPKRLADGSLFLPKPSQRQLSVRTMPAQLGEHAPAIDMQGRVVADTNGLGKVQATQPGRIEAGPRGLPQVGQAVRKGEVMAMVRFSVSTLERSAQLSQIAQNKVELQAAQARLSRLEQLQGIVAQKEIDAAKAEVRLIEQRGAFAAPVLTASEALIAPISGVVMSSSAAPGQVVDGREVVFEILDSSRLRVEVMAFDASAQVQKAFAVLGADQTVELQAAGSAPAMRDAARVLLFRPTGSLAAQLRVNQSLRVVAQGSQRVKGIALPSAALAKDPSNLDVVWVHTAAEQFAPRVVRWAALDGIRIVITDGLKAGDRVVTQGTALVNQVR